MKRHLYIVLFAILIFFSSICIFISNYFSFDGLLVNLATEVLGIILTVYFVDRIIRNYENEKWRGVEIKLKKYIQVLVNAIISSIRLAFGFSLEDICNREVYIQVFNNPNENMHLMDSELVRISKEILEPTVFVHVENMNKKSWDLLNTNLKNANDSVEKIISLFGAKLTPEQFEILLDVQEIIDSFFMQEATWPDFIAVSEENLPTGGRMPAKEWQHQIYIQLSRNIESMLLKVRELHGTIQKK